jgi:hypothetical protein
MCKKLKEKDNFSHFLARSIYSYNSSTGWEKMHTRTVRRLEHATMTTGNAANGEEKV